MRQLALFSLLLLAGAPSPSAARDIVIRDGQTQPENLTVTPDGDVIVGSFKTARIDIVRKDGAFAETFADFSAEGGSILGVLADPARGVLWACHFTPGPDGRRSNLRALDLETGAPNSRWDLPGFSTCNDMSVGADEALYIADTNGKIYRLPDGAASAELVMESPLLEGVDGITFLDGVLYVGNIRTHRFYRIPLGAENMGRDLVEITLDAPVNRPDGMRAANGKLFVAEAGGGRILELTITSNAASVTVVKSGLKQPTGVEPAGRSLWFCDLQSGTVSSVPLP